MAPHSRTVATSPSSGRRAQPRTGSARYSQEYVNAHPELCLAPRLGPIPLPQQASPVRHPLPHTTHPTAYAPQRRELDTRGALHLALTPQAPPAYDASRVYNLPAYTPANAYPATSPPPYAALNPPTSGHVAPPIRATPVPIPKPRYPTSPLTPEPSPPRSRPAVAPPRKRASADSAQHGSSPTT